MGTATATPSGMLCNAIARATGNATCRSVRPAMNVAKPSGKLWMPMARAVTVPVLIMRRRFTAAAGSCTEPGSCGLIWAGTSRSITPMTRMPAKNAATAAHGPAVGPEASVREVSALGMISMKDT